MTGGKGKGRASGAEDNDNPPTEQPDRNGSSMLERVTASATDLARSAFAAPNSNELSESASAILANSAKGGNVAGREGFAWAESSRVSQQTGLPTLQGQPLSLFRSGHREVHVQNAEAEFSAFLDGIDTFQPSTSAHNESLPAQEHNTEGELESISRMTYSGNDQALRTTYRYVEEQQLHNGEEVLAILSNPMSTVDSLEALPIEDEEVNWNLTEQQLSNLRTMMNELFPPSAPYVLPRADHPLHLLPSMTANADDAYMYYGQHVTQEAAKQMWIDQWQGVLTRYTDEVWGNLLPLVIVAREEIVAMKEQSPGTSIAQLKALRRLQLVLDHLRKS